ncbi:MAG: ribosome-associated translation inhibitor RaiA [Bdellovibrionales bacterium]|nr:ribosome-associated translation inhibitor RaiA [Bdellovibrionales bacterium]
MKVSCQFKSLQWSDALVDYTEEKLQKVKKFELKPIQVHVTFSAERHRKSVEMHIVGHSVSISGRGYADNFNEAVDSVVAKVTRQLSKRKQKIKKHKSFELSNAGQLDLVNAQMEFMSPEDPDDDIKKAG